MMAPKKLLLSTIVVSFTMWAIAGFWHEIIMAHFYSAETHAAHEGTLIILAAYLVLGFIMSYLFPLFCKNGRPLAEGLKFGILIGFLWVFPHELAMAGAHGTSLSYVFKNAGWHIIEQGLGGLIIGFFFKKN